MDYENAKEMWKLQEGGTGEVFRHDAELTVQRMERAAKWRRGILAWCTAMTIASAVLVAVVLIWRVPVDWREVWPVALLQAGAVLTVAVLWRVRKHRQLNYARYGASVREAAQWALDDIRRQVREMKVIGIWALVAVPLLSVQVAALYSSGKMNTQAVAGFGGLCAVVIGVNALFFAWRLQTRLRPDREKLTSMLREMEA